MDIKEVVSRADFKKFISLPDRIYEGDDNWVPKLNIDIKHLLGGDNPFYGHAFKKLFIAYRYNEPVGRIAAIIDWNYVDFQEKKTGFFGFFESVNDSKVAKALLTKVEKTLKEKGMKHIIGPMNPSSNDECGMLIDGFNSPPRIMMSYNPEYYINLLKEAGYEKAKDLYALNMNVEAGPQKRLERIVGKLKKRHPELNSRSIDIKNFKEEVNIIKDIYNNAWVKNWGFVPWTDAELNDIAKQLKPLVVKELVHIGCWEDKPIGFLMALPDYNEIIKEIGHSLFPFGWTKFLRAKKKIKNLRLMAMGVKRKYHNKGIGTLMYYNALVNTLKMGYKECEFSWILEDNTETLKIGRMMGAKIYKTYRIYGLDLT
ncbi:MAG: GNAT family N-acetyltransferase [Elusimicrobia bacterium]|jgi:GNAT superfamily N-acetyltransferase|nr:GNAT family N-acetyltransferase [Elusimicrobiota bacterium]